MEQFFSVKQYPGARLEFKVKINPDSIIIVDFFKETYIYSTIYPNDDSNYPSIDTGINNTSMAITYTISPTSLLKGPGGDNSAYGIILDHDNDQMVFGFDDGQEEDRDFNDATVTVTFFSNG